MSVHTAYIAPPHLHTATLTSRSGADSGVGGPSNVNNIKMVI